MQEVRLGQVQAIEEQEFSGVRTYAGTTGAPARHPQASSGHQSRKEAQKQSASLPQDGMPTASCCPGSPPCQSDSLCLSEANCQVQTLAPLPASCDQESGPIPQCLRVPISEMDCSSKAHPHTDPAGPPVLAKAVLCSLDSAIPLATPCDTDQQAARGLPSFQEDCGGMGGHMPEGSEPARGQAWLGQTF